MDVEEPLLLLRAQYLQLVDPDFLPWPPAALLRQADARKFLSEYLFNPRRLAHPPSIDYEQRVRDALSRKLVQAGGQDKTQPPSLADERRITLLESRSLLSGSASTGHRTWDGALHLAAYLLSAAPRGSPTRRPPPPPPPPPPPQPPPIAGRRIVELGAGTGLLSILCARYLGAAHVDATDGDDSVVAALAHNVRLNAAADRVRARKLRWGGALGELGDAATTPPPDLVLGADLIYNTEAALALAETLRLFLEQFPHVAVLLSTALRFLEPYEAFVKACVRNGLSVQEIPYAVVPRWQQKSLFYTSAVPLKLLQLSKGREG